MHFSLQPFFLSLLLLLLLLSPILINATPSRTVKPASACTCWISSASQIYTHQKTFDFSKLDTKAAIPALASVRPKNFADGDTDLPVQSGYLTSDAFTESFEIETWGQLKSADTKRKAKKVKKALKKNVLGREVLKGMVAESEIAERDFSDATVDRSNSVANVYIASSKDGSAGSTSKLVLRAHRFKDFHSTGEINGKDTFHHFSIRIHSRVIGAPGVCAGQFTLSNPEGSEADIEVLTSKDINTIYYTTFPTNDETAQDLKPVKWDTWHKHRVDWVGGAKEGDEGNVTWYVDGSVVNNGKKMPLVESFWNMNMWGDGGSWTDVAEEGAEAFLEVEWLQLNYNVSNSDVKVTDPKACCKLD